MKMQTIEIPTQVIQEQDPINTTKDDTTEKVKKMKNWNKSLGQDEIHVFQLKRVTTLHDKIAKQMNNILDTGQHPE